MADQTELVQYHKDADNNIREVFNKVVNTISKNHFDNIELMPKSSQVAAKYDGIADKLLLLILKHIVEPAKINNYIIGQEKATEGEDLIKHIKQIDMTILKMKSLSEQVAEKANTPIFMGKFARVSSNFSQDKVLSKFPMLYNPEYSFVTTELNAGAFIASTANKGDEAKHNILYVIVGDKGFNILSFDICSNSNKTKVMLPRSFGYQVLGYSPLITTTLEVQASSGVEDDEDDENKSNNVGKQPNIRCILLKQQNSMKKIPPKSYNMLTGDIYAIATEAFPKVS